MSSINIPSSRQFHQNLHKSILRSENMAAKANKALNNKTPYGANNNTTVGTTTNSNTGPRPIDNNKAIAESLAEAFEEATSLHAGRVEASSKRRTGRNVTASSTENTEHLGDRRLGSSSVQRIENLVELYQLMDDQNQDRLDSKLQTMNDRLASGKPLDDADELVELAGGDPARAHVLLGMVQRNADHAGQNDIAKTASIALELLEKQRGNEVRFGKNSAHAIADLTTDPEEKQNFRNIFYGVLRTVAKHGDMAVVKQKLSKALAKGIMEFFGKTRFPVGLRVGQRALADDIAALTPSISVKSLHILHSGLHQLGMMNGLHADGETMLQSLHNSWKKSREEMGDEGKGYDAPDFKRDGIDLAFSLMDVAETGLYPRDLHGMTTEYAGSFPRFQSEFANRMLSLMHKLPASIWAEPKNRQDAFDLIRGLITQLSEKEKGAQHNQRLSKVKLYMSPEVAAREVAAGREPIVSPAKTMFNRS